METASKNVYDRIFCGLKKTFDDKESTYKDIRELLAPGTGLFNGERGNDDLENVKINYMRLLDSEPITFLDTTVAGLFGGLINPASRWFDLGVDQSNPLYRELDPFTIGEMTSYVKEFLYYLFNKSNFYPAANSVINEWVRYGIGVMLVEERDQDLIFFNPLTMGEFYLGIDSNGKYDKKNDGHKFVIAISVGYPVGEIYRNPDEFQRKALTEITDREDRKLRPLQYAPSATNSQPWYITHNTDGTYNIYREKLGLIKRNIVGRWNPIDIGIALAHIYITNRETFKFTMEDNPMELNNYIYEGTFEI